MNDTAQSTSTPTSTPTPAAIAAGLYTAIAGDDFVSARQFLADDVVLHVPGTHPLAGDHHGPDGFERFVRSGRTLTDNGEQIELIDLLEGREHAAAYCRVSATRAGRERLVNTTVHMLRVSDGKIVEAWLHNWDDLTVDQFWR